MRDLHAAFGAVRIDELHGAIEVYRSALLRDVREARTACSDGRDEQCDGEDRPAPHADWTRRATGFFTHGSAPLSGVR